MNFNWMLVVLTEAEFRWIKTVWQLFISEYLDILLRLQTWYRQYQYQQLEVLLSDKLLLELAVHQ